MRNTMSSDTMTWLASCMRSRAAVTSPWEKGAAACSEFTRVVRCSTAMLWECSEEKAFTTDPLKSASLEKGWNEQGAERRRGKRAEMRGGVKEEVTGGEGRREREREEEEKRGRGPKWRERRENRILGYEKLVTSPDYMQIHLASFPDPVKPIQLL